MAMTEEEKKLRRKEINKKYRKMHKEELKEKDKEYRKKHKEKIKERMRKYYDENKERCKKRKEEYRKNHIEEINKKDREKHRSMSNNGRIFYGYNPYKLANAYYNLINPESSRFSPVVVNSNMSLETYIAMRAVFDSITIQTLMMNLYYGKIQLEEIEDMIKTAGFDMNSEKFIKLMDCINKSKSVYSFYKNYNGEIFS